MPQVLKEEVRDRLLTAATEVFYECGFADARLSDIAKRAGISTGLVYSYFIKNKEALFGAVVSALPLDFDGIARAEESLAQTSPLARYRAVAEGHIDVILMHHREFVILMDKSHGTIYQNAKNDLVESVRAHIERELFKNGNDSYPALLPHVLASNFVEGLLEVARHYESPEQAHELFELIVRCYYEGVDSL